MLKKLFGGINMTWVKVIIFAIIMGIYVGLIALLVPDKNFLHNIAVTEERWLLPAVIIIVNCKKHWEAALKTFVFFLISQPLVYLVQVPFNSMGWQLFGYYKYWFIITCLTLPGAFIAWFIKKDNILSAIILSVATGILGIHIVASIRNLSTNPVNNIINVIYCAAVIALFIAGVLGQKKTRIIATCITLAVILGFGGYSKFIVPEVDVITVIDVNAELGIEMQSDWTVTSEDEKYFKGKIVEFEDDAGKHCDLNVEFLKKEPGIFILTDPNGKEYKVRITLVENDFPKVEDLTGK